MTAERGHAEIPDDDAIVLMEEDELRALLKKVKQDRHDETEQPKTPGKKLEDDENGIKTQLNSFNSKPVSKPSPWAGDDEAQYKTWNEKFITHMANA